MFFLVFQVDNWELLASYDSGSNYMVIYRVIAGPSLCYRHHQEKQCGFRIHPARLIFIKQRELTQDQSGQNGLISFVWGTKLVGCGRAETVSPGQLGGLVMGGALPRRRR